MKPVLFMLRHSLTPCLLGPWTTRIECLKEFLVDPVKAAIGHQHHDVAGAMLAHDRADDVLDAWDVTGVLPLPAQIGDKTLGGQALGFWKRRPKDASDHDFVCTTERRREVILEYTST
jgi:hypothetical protein